ncbi:diguanylate cyclase [Thermodesulfobacteriota bacterium]
MKPLVESELAAVIRNAWLAVMKKIKGRTTASNAGEKGFLLFFISFWQNMLTGLNPKQWTLKTRLLYLPSFLIVLFIILLLSYLYQAYTVQTELAAENQLSLLSHWINHEIEQHTQLLLTKSSSIANDPHIRQAMADEDRETLKNFTLQYRERMQMSAGQTSDLSFHFYRSPAVSFFQSRFINKWGDDLSKEKPLVLLVNRELRSYGFLEGNEQGLNIVAVSPIVMQDEQIGALEVSLSLNELLENIKISSPFGIILLADEKGSASGIVKEQPDMTKRILLTRGHVQPETVSRLINIGHIDPEFEYSYKTINLNNFQDVALAQLILVYDAASDSKIYHRDIFSFLLVLGSVLLMLILYSNLLYISHFLTRLKKILISSHFNDFSERFESDHIHCLHVLHCTHKECPVFQNPSLVCYLETGSQAISTKWRNSCLFLNKFKDCTNCPVYSKRIKDELVEMRNVVNTTMRLLSDFLDRIGGLLAEVMRSTFYQSPKMSLDNVAVFLEQMANVTNFSRYLQGARSEEDVYRQLAYIFEKEFNIDYYILLGVNPKENSMEVKAENRGDEPLCLKEVSINSELCRAKRVAELVHSCKNPILCPYFNINHDDYHRYCLPMVMAGSVGMVFSFAAPKEQYQTRINQIILLQKYLDESAPVLNSLRLLNLSKDQSLKDPLTLCNNRRFLEEYIRKYEPLAIRKGSEIGFLMIDLDYFKKVNDEFGHEAGDVLLKQMVNIMREQIRASDLLIRYGGEEFLIIMPEAESASLEMVAEKIRTMVDQYSFTLPGGDIVHHTISIGLAVFPNDADSMNKAIRFADIALYEAKRVGRNKVVRFMSEMWLESEHHIQKL